MSIRLRREKELIDTILDIGFKDIVDNPNVGRCFNRLCQCGSELVRHSINVAILSVIIGIYVFEDKNDSKDLFIVGLLHDYGKLFVPDSILNKSLKLTSKEREEIEKHSFLGYKYLAEEKCFGKDILLGVLDHHERGDGSGYGYGKTSKEISELAKIIMIADVYDAMVTDRVYRARLDKAIVNEYLINNAGTQFSRNLIKSFLNNTIALDLNYVIREAYSNIFGYEQLEKLSGSR